MVIDRDSEDKICILGFIDPLVLFIKLNQTNVNKVKKARDQ